MEVRVENREMIFKVPLFELRQNNDNNWKKMTEKDFLLNLNNSFTQITPALEKMFDGEEIVTSSIIFRIRN